jgi:hypothetical protein
MLRPFREAVSVRYHNSKENQMHPSSIAILPSELSTVDPTPDNANEAWTGHISDSFCGATHHRFDQTSHRKMSDRECTLACVSDGAQFVFVSRGDVYHIANQDFPALLQHAGHTVYLTGVRTADTIQITSIVMPATPGNMVAVLGVHYDKAQADACVEALVASGFSKDAVSILAPDILGSKDLSHDRHSRAGNSTAVVTSSIAIGGTIGLVAGLGALAIPGAGPLAVAGPLLGALAGMGAGGAVGGAIDAIDAAGPPDAAAKIYEGTIPEGGILVTVHCHTADEVSRAKELLTVTGAQAITSSDEAGESQ